MPKHFNDNFIASVPEFTPTAYLVPINLANDLSNFCKGFPSVKSPVDTKFLNLSKDHHNLKIVALNMNILLSFISNLYYSFS